MEERVTKFENKFQDFQDEMKNKFKRDNAEVHELQQRCNIEFEIAAKNYLKNDRRDSYNHDQFADFNAMFEEIQL